VVEMCELRSLRRPTSARNICTAHTGKRAYVRMCVLCVVHVMMMMMIG